MVAAHVFSDGSCVHQLDGRTWSSKGPGGWAAVVELGSNGWVLRGRNESTTSTEMELVAMIEGLRSVPDRTATVLHTDCHVALVVRDRWQTQQLPKVRSRYAHARLWRDLARQFARLTVAIDLVESSKNVPQHMRAHVIAGASAKACARGQQNPPLEKLEQRARQSSAQRRAQMARAEKQNATPLPPLPDWFQRLQKGEVVGSAEILATRDPGGAW